MWSGLSHRREVRQDDEVTCEEWACKPDSVLLRTGAVMAIHLGDASPRRSSRDPKLGGQPHRFCSRCTGWGLPSRVRYRPRWCALTAPFHPYHPHADGGLLSVARAVELPRPGVTWHPCPVVSGLSSQRPRRCHATIRPTPRCTSYRAAGYLRADSPCRDTIPAGDTSPRA